MTHRFVRHASVAAALALVAAACTKSPARPSETGAVSYNIRARAVSITAIGTCDDIFQGIGEGEFAIWAGVADPSGDWKALTATPSYPGNPNNLVTHVLASNAVVAVNGEVAFDVPDTPGQTVGVAFRATEWDNQLVVIPPSIIAVPDGFMNDLAQQTTFVYTNGSWQNMGSRDLLLGAAGCSVRFAFNITATRK